MDWEGFALNTFLPVVASFLAAYLLGRRTWLRNARKETAQKRLDEVLNPMRCVYDKVMTHLKATGEPLFFWAGDYYKELQRHPKNSL